VEDVVEPVVILLQRIVGQTVADEQGVAALEDIVFVPDPLLIDLDLQPTRQLLVGIGVGVEGLGVSPRLRPSVEDLVGVSVVETFGAGLAWR